MAYRSHRTGAFIFLTILTLVILSASTIMALDDDPDDLDLDDEGDEGADELESDFPNIFPKLVDEMDDTDSSMMGRGIFDRKSSTHHQLLCHHCNMDRTCFKKRKGIPPPRSTRKYGCHNETHICVTMGPNPNPAPGKAKRSCMERSIFKKGAYQTITSKDGDKFIYAKSCQGAYCNSDEWMVYKTCLPDPKACGGKGGGVKLTFNQFHNYHVPIFFVMGFFQL